MSVFEIICGVILMLAAVVIIILTMTQESKGKGLSGAIMGEGGQMEAGRASGKDAKMALYTRYVGIAFVAVTILVSVLSARLG